MPARALFLLSILTFGGLSEAQPTPGGLKNSFIFSCILLRPVIEHYFQQNTRTLHHQGVGNWVGAGITRSLLQPPQRTEPLLLSRHLHSSVQARTHTSNPRLSTASNHGISDQNSQPNNNGTRPVTPFGTGYDLLNTAMRHFIREHGTNYHSLEALRQDIHRDPMTPLTPLNGELALLATNLGFTWSGQQPTSQATSSQRREGLFADTTQIAVAIHAYFNEQPWAIGVHLATMLRYLLIRGLQNSPEGVIKQLSNSLEPSHPYGNGGCIGIVPIVSVVDLNPDIRDQRFVQLTEETVRLSNNHNHPPLIAAATAIALTARSSIDYRESFLREGQRPSRQEFAEATIARIRQHVQDGLFLHYLGIVEQNLDGSNSHASVMSQLNRDPLGEAVANDEGVLNTMTRRAPNTTVAGIAAGLHFFFSETQSQQALLNLADQYTVDRDIIGAILMALSALREGGFWRDEFSTDEIRSLLEQFPDWVKIRRDPNIFLIDPPASKGTPQSPKLIKNAKPTLLTFYEA